MIALTCFLLKSPMLHFALATQEWVMTDEIDVVVETILGVAVQSRKVTDNDAATMNDPW